MLTLRVREVTLLKQSVILYCVVPLLKEILLIYFVMLLQSLLTIKVGIITFC